MRANFATCFSVQSVKSRATTKSVEIRLVEHDNNLIGIPDDITYILPIAIKQDNILPEPIIQNNEPVNKFQTTERRSALDKKNMDNLDMLTPGKGKKFLFKSEVNNKSIYVLIDTGSSTSIVSKSLVIDLNISYYTSRIPVNFLGMFGEKLVSDAKFANIAIKVGNSNLALPAYILDTLPEGVDVLIGMDQIGKSLGISIDLFNNSFISIFDSSNLVYHFQLTEGQGLVQTDIDTKIPVFCSKLSTSSDEVSTRFTEKPIESSLNLPVMRNINLVEQSLDQSGPSNDEVSTRFTEKPFEKTVLDSKPIYVKYEKFDPNLLSSRIELENISSALALLRHELERLISSKITFSPPNDKNNIDQNIIKSRRSRSITYELNQSVEQSDILIHEMSTLIDALARELSRLKKSFRRKKSRREKSNRRNLRKDRNELITSSINLIETRTITPDVKKYTPNVDADGKPIITTIDIVELIIDKGLYSRKMDTALVISEIEKVFVLSDNTIPLLDSFREEIVNLVQVSSKKLEDSEPEMADWKNDVKRRDVLVHHHLLTDEVVRLNEVLGRYASSVLIGPRDELVMGQATLRGQPIKYRIELIPEGLTILQKKKKVAYPTKRPLRDLMKSTAVEMEKSGVGRLNDINFSASFTSPVFFVKNKAKYRLVCDYKDLNSVTQDDIYPLPHMEYIFENLGNTKGTGNKNSYFSIIDLKSGYWQIPLEEMAQKLAAVMLPFGIFKFICLPFGLKNAPAFFQRYMDEVLKEGLGNFVFVYIDDIVIFSDTFDNHIQHLNSVLGYLKDCNLKANIEKCHFCLSQLRVLGKIVNKDGLATDPELVRAMVEFPSPGNDIGNVAKKKLKRFLAMHSYYRGYIKDFGPQTDLLSKLLKEDYLWDKNSWKTEHEQAFSHLKNLMLQAPVLAFPDTSKPFYMQSDASKVGAGAVLYQMNDLGHRCVVSYASWLFSDTQRRYNTTERELLGLILAVRKWKPFFHHTKFFAETDHQPLVGYLRLDDPYGKIARWAAELAQFSFEIKYIKGETNIPSDTLSRTGEEVALLEEVFTYAIPLDNNNEFIEKDQVSYRPSKVLSKAFSDEDIELFTCIDTSLENNEEVICTNNLYFAMPTDNEWISAQSADAELSNIISWIKHGTLPSDEKEALAIAKLIKYYTLDSSGILVYKREGEDESYRRCVPAAFRRIVLSECHDSIWSGGHLGRDKTKNKLRDNYFFPRMDQYTDIWIKTCPTCLSTKRKHPTKHKIPLGTIIAHQTWELLSIDLWEAGVMSDRGHKYVLTIIDAFSKFALAIPIKNKTAETIASKLYKHVFSKFGYPNKLHSDNGLEFCNAILKALCDKLKIEKSRTTAYHPQGNAFAERIHQFFRNALAAFVGRDQRDWDLLIPGLVSVYQQSIHSALGGFTPAQVMFGRKMYNPIDNNIDTNIVPEGTSVPNYVAKLMLALNRVQEQVSKIVKDKQFKNIQPSLGKTILSYNVGDKVGLEVESIPAGVKSTKLFPRYAGPFTITRVKHGGKVLYLADINGKERKVPNSIQKVKPWPDRQTLLEQFEKYEISKVQSKKKFIIKTPIVNNNDMDVENQTIISKIDESKNDIDDDIYYNPDDYDIMGNRIERIALLREEILQKFNSTSEAMFIIEIIKQYQGRELGKNFMQHQGRNLGKANTTLTSNSDAPLDQQVLFIDFNSNLEPIIDYINIIII